MSAHKPLCRPINDIPGWKVGEVVRGERIQRREMRVKDRRGCKRGGDKRREIRVKNRKGCKRREDSEKRDKGGRWESIEVGKVVSEMRMRDER